MKDKISIALAGISDIKPNIRNIIGRIFSDDNVLLTTELIKSPFFLFPYKDKSSDSLSKKFHFVRMNSLKRDDQYLIGIFINKNNPSPNDFKFTIITSMDGNSIAYKREKDDRTIAGRTNESYESFIESFDNYHYAFSFLLNDEEIFPKHTIRDFNKNRDVNFTLKDVISYMNYCYENPVIETDPHKINLFGIRSNYKFEDNKGEWMYAKRHQFYDYLLMFYIDANKSWQSEIYNFTTLPDSEGGTRASNPEFSPLYPKKRKNNDLGAPIICPGQHIDAFQIGLHNGTHTALKQKGILKHYRDNSVGTKGYYDFNLNSKKYDNIDRYGDNIAPGTNLHTTFYKNKGGNIVFSKKKQGSEISTFSIGCQVIGESKDKWKQFMALMEKQTKNTDKSTFTYTLIEEYDFLQFLQIINGED